MSTNPFDDENATFIVLVNQENQHSLWPAHIVVPQGWSVVHESDTRHGCLAYIEANWTDIRPASLIEQAEGR